MKLAALQSLSGKLRSVCTRRGNPSISAIAALFVVFACLVLLAFNGWRSMSARHQQLDEARTAASNLARAVSQHANDTLRIADSTLMSIVLQPERLTPDDAGRNSMHRMLVQLAAESPLLDKLTVLDQQGRWLVDSQSFMRSDEAGDFRDHVNHHQNNASDAAFIGPPVRERGSGAWTIAVSRKINDSGGRFAGVAVASIDLAYFRSFHGGFDIGNQGAIMLLLADGRLLTRRPLVDGLTGKHVSDWPLYREHLARNKEGTALLSAQQDGVERIYGYGRLGDYPLIAVAALGKDDVLESWRFDTIINTIAVSVLVLLLEFLGFRLVRQIRSRAQAEAALEASEFRWKNALESTGDVVWDFDHATGALNMSRAWTSLMGYPPEEPGRRLGRFRNLIYPDDRPAAVAKFERYLRGDTSEYTNTQRVRTRDGKWKWLLTRGMVVARDAAGRPLRTLGTHTDISEQKFQEEELRNARDALEARVAQRTAELQRINRALEMLGRCNAALLRSTDEPDLLQQVCNVIREVGGYRMAWVGYAEHDAERSIRPVAHAGDEQDKAYLKRLTITWSDQHPAGSAPAGKAIRSGQAVMSGDLQRDSEYEQQPVFAPWLRWVARRGYRSVYCLPLRERDRTFGVLAMYSDNAQPAAAEETRLLQELADNLAYGIVTLRAQDEKRRMQAAVLKMAAGVSASMGKQFFEQLCRNITDALHAQAALAIRLRPDKPDEAVTIAAIVDGVLIPNCTFSIPGSPCAALLRRAASAGPALLEGRFPAGSALAGLAELPCVGALLEDAAGTPIGMLLVLGPQALPASDFGLSTLRIFAARAAMEMEREAATERIRAQASLLDKAQDAIIVRDLGHGIHFWNNGATRLYGWSGEEAVGKSIDALLYSDPAQFYAATRHVLDAGEWRGEIVQQRKDGRSITVEGHWTLVRDDAGQPKSILAINTDVSERNAAQEKIERLAYYDPLTGLPNRVLLRERLQTLLNANAFNESLAAVFFIDLDNFKTLNDSLGHDQGDLLLQLVAKRLGGCAGPDATVARLGGDEFVILLPGLAHDIESAEEQACRTGRLIIEALNAPYHLATLTHHSTVSIGIALIVQRSDTITDLLKRADLAMYQAKSAGKNTLRIFTPDMQHAVTVRAELEADLRRALARGELVLYYQAQVDAGSSIIGAEALVRWQSPARGLVGPALFIPLAEESGLILELGRMVLEAACATLSRWADVPAMADLTLAVNVSARQFLHPDFVAQVLAILDHSGADPRRLKLELTETVIIEEVDAVIEKMGMLKGHGVMFSLDDFGIGYSSLSYLKRLPLDQIKIDQSFVRDVLVDPNDAVIVKSIIALGQSLGLALIAEGVETTEQRDFLASHGCRAYQGYLFSKPLPLAGFELLCSPGAPD